MTSLQFDFTFNSSLTLKTSNLVFLQFIERCKFQNYQQSGPPQVKPQCYDDKIHMTQFLYIQV